MKRDDMMQTFQMVSQLGPQEATFYLETNAWDLTDALAEWHEENQWEIEQVRGCFMWKITGHRLLYSVSVFVLFCVTT